MKIGIMGGTFDPVHIGHLLLGEFAYEQYNLDEVWFLPNGTPPHKETKSIGTSFEHRAAMVKSAIWDTPYFKLSLHEAIGGVHYTYQTLYELRELYPQHEFYFILGADSLFSIETWMHFREIFPSCTILAAMRDDKDAKEMEKQIEYLTDLYDAKICLLRAPLIEISSTTIRNRIMNNQSVRYMVPDSVVQYIDNNKLYYEET